MSVPGLKRVPCYLWLGRPSTPTTLVIFHMHACTSSQCSPLTVIMESHQSSSPQYFPCHWSSPWDGHTHQQACFVPAHRTQTLRGETESKLNYKTRTDAPKHLNITSRSVKCFSPGVLCINPHHLFEEVWNSSIEMHLVGFIFKLRGGGNRLLPLPTCHLHSQLHSRDNILSV